jgi:hypothetical protein
MNRQQFDALTAPQGALLVGSPQEVIERYFTNMNFFNTPFSWHKKALCYSLMIKYCMPLSCWELK